MATSLACKLPPEAVMSNGQLDQMPQDGGMTAPKPIADKLRESAKASGMSINALAQKADVAVASVHKFMHGGTISMQSAEAIARALGKKIELIG
jgi:ribosome-binding protein aMBF1 (putative translation factor)